MTLIELLTERPWRAALAELAWRAAAFVLSRRAIAYYLIRRAQRTPYFHLPGYMERWWLFNAYDSNPDLPAEQRRAAMRFPRLPSVRVHHILRKDLAEHPHDHPWDARTIILDGWYVERRHRAGSPFRSPRRVMARGATARIAHGSYHHIEAVSDAGVWTLFLTWDYRGTWGFLVDGQKVPWREYEALAEKRAATFSGELPGLQGDVPGVFEELPPFDATVERVCDPVRGAAAEGWSGWATQYPGKLPKLYGAEEIARLNWHPRDGQDLIRVAEMDRITAGDWLAAAQQEVGRG